MGEVRFGKLMPSTGSGNGDPDSAFPNLFVLFIYLFTIQVFRSTLNILDRSKKEKQVSEMAFLSAKVIIRSVDKCLKLHFQKQPLNWTMLFPLGVDSIL